MTLDYLAAYCVDAFASFQVNSTRAQQLDLLILMISFMILIILKNCSWSPGIVHWQPTASDDLFPRRQILIFFVVLFGY